MEAMCFKNKLSKPPDKEFELTFTKRKVNLILNNAIVWVYLSYVLALLGRTDIAEQLSITVVKVIIYTFIPYLCKALFENIFKYRWNGGDCHLASPKTINEVLSETKDVCNNDEYINTISEDITDSEDAVG